MAYESSFNPSYPEWHDLPTEDTPVSAAVMTNYDTVIQNIDTFLDGSTAVNPDSKTNNMTSPVGVDSSGKLWSIPGGSSGGGTAIGTTYDNTQSGLTATNVQEAIDEVVQSGGSASGITYDNTSSQLMANDVQEAIDEIVVNPPGGTAAATSYDNTSSGLTATDVQDAIDELAQGGGSGSTFENLTVGSRKTGTSTGLNSVAQGYQNQASAYYSFAGGANTIARATSAVAFGVSSEAAGQGSAAFGNTTKAGSDYQFVCGKYNSNTSTNIFEVGCGGSAATKKNGLYVTTSGNVGTSGEIVAAAETTLSDSDYIYISVSGVIKKITLANLKTVLGL